MMRFLSSLFTALLLISLPAAAATAADFWEEAADAKNFGASLTFASDYVFRGVSQTDNKPAVQGSFDYKHPAGLALGVWGSNVDDAVSRGNIEIDVYAGWGVTVWERLSVDASLIYYVYPGSGDDPKKNYVEGHLGVEVLLKEFPLSPKIGLGYNYSPDFFGEDGAGHYLSARLDLGLPYEFTLYGLVGYQWVEGEKSTGKGAGENGEDGYDYVHWRIGVMRPLLGFQLDLSYQDTDSANFLGRDIADERIVFSISRTF